MSIKLCQAAGSVVTPIDDAQLYSWIANRAVGVVTGCVVTSAGTNQLSISAGWGIVQGHVFTVGAETIAAAVAPSGTVNGRLLIRIDTSDADTPVQFVTQAATPLPALTQEAIDGSGSIYELPLATYTVGTISISGLTDARNMITSFVTTLGAATAAQGAKADLLKAGAVYSTTEVETGEVGPTGKKWYRKDYTGTFPTITTDTASISITPSGVTKGVRVEAGTANASNGDFQPTGYAFYLASPSDKQWSSFCIYVAGNLVFNYGIQLGGKPFIIHFTYEK